MLSQSFYKKVYRLTQTVSSVVTMATLWLPEVDSADAATAKVFSDEHCGKVAPLNLLKTKHREGIRSTDRFLTDLVYLWTDDDSDLLFGPFGTASRWGGAQSTAHLPQKKKKKESVVTGSQLVIVSSQRHSVNKESPKLKTTEQKCLSALTQAANVSTSG